MEHLTENSWYEVVENPVPLLPGEFKKIWDAKPTEKHYITVFGKTHPVPRTQVMYGSSYKFSGNVLNPQPGPFPGYIKRCLEYAKERSPQYPWNAALVNFYESGSEYIGVHSDDEGDLARVSGKAAQKGRVEPGAPIYSFSYGASRIFRIKPKKQAGWAKIDIDTSPRAPAGRLIIMGGAFQREFTHQVPKTKKKVGPRINVTIRAMRAT